MIKKESFSEIMEKYSNSSYEQIDRNIAKFAVLPVKKILGYNDGEFIKLFVDEASEYLDVDEKCCYNMNFKEFLNIFERYLHDIKIDEDYEVSKEDGSYLRFFLLMRYINKSVKENFAVKRFFAVNYDIFCNYIVSKYSDIDIKKLKVPDSCHKSADSIGDVLNNYLNHECVEYWTPGEDINEYVQEVRKAYDVLYKGIYCLIARVLTGQTGTGVEEIHKKDADEIQHTEKSGQHDAYVMPETRRYEGGRRDDIPDGRGIFTDENGTVYDGEWKDGRRNGQGTMTYPDGRVYKGEWKNNRINGYGTMIYADGRIYEGEWKVGKKHGQGTETDADGRIYAGEWKDDWPNGQGTWTSTDGMVYKGEFKDGRRNGQGTYTFADGRVHEGEWKDNLPNGHGIITYANGDAYEGEFKDGKKHGHGTYTYADGDVYDGESKDGKKHDHGTYTWANGVIYEGEWKEGKKHGHGTYTFADGVVYEGEFKDDFPNGHGTMIYADGTVCEGEWKDGKIERRNQ